MCMPAHEQVNTYRTLFYTKQAQQRFKTFLGNGYGHFLLPLATLACHACAHRPLKADIPAWTRALPALFAAPPRLRQVHRVGLHAVAERVARILSP